MPGMTSNPGSGSTVLVSAFRSALLHQWLIVALIFAVLLLAWATARTVFAGVLSGPSAAGGRPWREPRARLLLRVGFGILWLFDGLLQVQPQMPGGLADQVIQPTAASSPGWVQHLVNFGVNLWDYHPVPAAASAVWIQVGIGLWLLLAVRGWSARLAGLAAVAWGLVVWVFGEAFGGIFAPGLTVLFGAPGAVLIYVVAGALLDPPRAGLGPPGPARPPAARRDRRLLPRHGAAPGVAGTRLLAGKGGWPARFAGGHDRDHGGHIAAACHPGHRLLVRELHPQPRFRGQPGRRHRARRHRRGPVRRCSAGGRAARQDRGRRRGRVLPRRLGAHPGLRVLRRARHRPELHGPVHPPVQRRVPGAGPGTRARNSRRAR